jgi:transcriptional regulator with XRE-family HTH domain
MFPAQGKLLAAFGERLRLARLRRQLSVDAACERAGISRMTLYRAEEGSPAVALGTYLRILSVLKLEADLDLVARDDKLGRMLQDAELPARRRRASVAKGAPGSRGLPETRRERGKS